VLRAIDDYIGMTARYAIPRHEELVGPAEMPPLLWEIRR
jgi:hypothetical protein